MLRNSVEQLDTRILTNMLMLMGNLLNDNVTVHALEFRFISMGV